MEKSSDRLPISKSTRTDVHRSNTDDTDPSDVLLPSSSFGPGTSTTFPSTSIPTTSNPVPDSDSLREECTSDQEVGVKRKFDEYENEAHICIKQKTSHYTHTDFPERGVKRKFYEYENEAHICTKQKTSHYTHTDFARGVKRKFVSDQSEETSKQFKTTQPEVAIEKAEAKTDVLVSKRLSDAVSNSIPKIEDSASCSYSEESRVSSHSQPIVGSSKDKPEEESTDAQSDQEDEVYSCPKSCVCKVGHSLLPEPTERTFPTPAPLYKSVLMRRLYSLPNTQNTCCKRRCVRRCPRESVLRVTLRHMTEDYYDSDLRVARYSWGEWTDPDVERRESVCFKPTDEFYD